MKISKRLVVFVGLLCAITLAIPSHVFCQAEGAGGAAAPAAGTAEAGAGAAGAEAGGATVAGASAGTIAIGAAITIGVVGIAIGASGGGGSGTTTNH